MTSYVTIDWLIAKALPDHRRFEPRNVGVLLLHGEIRLARFVGDLPGGGIDADVERAVGVGDGYGRWVETFRGCLARGWEPDRFGVAPVGNYRNVTVYLDRGTMPVDGVNRLLAEMSPEGALEHLFNMLVAPAPVGPLLAVQESARLVAGIDCQLTAIVAAPRAWVTIGEQEAIARTLVGMREELLAPTRPPPIDERALRAHRRRHGVDNACGMSQLKDQEAFTRCLAGWIAIVTHRDR